MENNIAAAQRRQAENYDRKLFPPEEHAGEDVVGLYTQC